MIIIKKKKKTNPRISFINNPSPVGEHTFAPGAFSCSGRCARTTDYLGDSRKEGKGGSGGRRWWMVVAEGSEGGSGVEMEGRWVFSLSAELKLILIFQPRVAPFPITAFSRFLSRTSAWKIVYLIIVGMRHLILQVWSCFGFGLNIGRMG